MDETALLLANRCFVYAFLARGFAEEPDEGFLEVLAGDHLTDELGLVEDEFSVALDAALARMRQCAAGDAFAASGEERLAQLREEYAAVFVGPGPLLASPWESMHRTKKRVLFQASVLEVRDAYRAAGLLPERYGHVSDDFIGLEMDFMAKLAQMAFDARGSGDGERCTQLLCQSRAFLDQHLLKWVGSLAKAIQVHYRNSFYSALAEFAALFLKRDSQLVDWTIAKLD
ncbi:MAG: molecular chaperone TorD family protein [Eggerthellaceae bacterium]|nr:molecular chaperone TorD family protein [Eggerthellaceae bacterium]